ncbi:hypothetical protein C6P46_004064 [Rhodotorula mucilaginosa]|uniref:Vacuolar sorting protein Vps3844 C-terminal domain-containing protein n=1 Tax=Rhodotorula mucilaginosa TaxID=5537 RepID=A0A9P6W0L7_RHOMI|nr:hypothetical protein C6P46_004064 [Rhodotorula mucilaginosa]TKA50903.1 hypothetical protein B0A53_05774 [Rhodotorula sp. CCFEE 5036]
MVLLPYAAAGLILPTLCYAAAPTPQLYIHPSPFPPSFASAGDDPIVLTAPQTNAVLAHHLGVDKHVNWPIASTKQVGGRDWELALGDSTAASLATALPTRQRVVVVLECGKQGCDDAIPLHLRPEANSGSRPIVLPALAPNSYLAALSLHLHRLADSLGLDPTSVIGLQDFVEQGIKAVKGWQGWVSEELGNWIGWHDGDNAKATVIDEPKIDNAGLVNDLDLLDGSAKQLIFDLNKLANLTDSVVSNTRQHQAQNDLDSGAQGQADKPPVTVIHLTGLKDVAAKHSRSSDMYQRSAALLQQTLTAALAALAPPSPDGGVSSPDPKVILLALPEPKTPLLRRRKPWLEAFETGAGKQTRGVGVAAKRNGGGGALEKRNVFSPEHSLRRRRLQSDEDGDDSGNNNNGTFLVPSSYRCFPSRSELVNLTASCLGHGQPVKGLTTRSDLPEGGECWVCKCGTTTDEETGKKTRWTGQGCEKVDLSSDFALLSLTTLGLLGVVALSVGLLYSIGAQELPGTLGAVGGDGGRMKRD